MDMTICDSWRNIPFIFLDFLLPSSERLHEWQKSSSQLMAQSNYHYRKDFDFNYVMIIEKVLDLVQESPENSPPCLFASCLDDVSVTRDDPIKVPTSNKFRMFTSSS
jgi:hypothetical protein